MVDTLQAKPSEMPYEKEELLNAAVCRVDALEAELIATKKALHDALMRQEELLAYIDSQEEAKFRKKKFCWYDFRAGFWGVMGQPCLGIIPPFIEEFDYPMPPNCAAGNTGVFINGRELHQKDLDLLAARGLPTTRDKSYIIEISGRVLDEDTGEELDSLGKLAPTVERVKHGFGMKAPRALAQ
ncbi:hypothetical protein F0562_010396 [Nyssa sinensis]|uniref:Uncharacterized protein n=1 Tax=Nyssa sinensis TaxID=561372 RepID=A0A5J4ZZC0_9ASTE|nr:hypothetical protein F0562_010396 [Nyssa sinensis]